MQIKLDVSQFSFSLGKTGKTNSNTAITLTIDFVLSLEVSWPCLHIHVLSLQLLSPFQAVLGTFLVVWVVLPSLEEKPGGT